MTSSDYDDSFIADTLPAFISEAQEQIEMLEQLLLQLEGAPEDRNLLDALFRCVHTVKGSAGIFGLDRVVAFTHHVETLLDRLREGDIHLTADLGSLLLQCNDEIRLLVESARSTGADSADAVQNRERLVQRLMDASGESGAPESAAPAVADARQARPQPSAQERRWHIAVKFGADTYRNGMDPLAILNYVRRLGAISRIVCDVDAIPALEDLDPESCQLGFVFSLDTAATREQIEAAFSFVREDCCLRLLSPDATAAEVAALVEGSPDLPRLGALLAAAGGIPQGVTDSPAGAAVAGGTTGQDAEAVPKGSPGPQHVSVAQDPRTPTRDSAAPRSAGGEDRYIRVHADRLDEVINLLGELVTAGAGASLLARQSRQSNLIEANEQITRLIEEIRNGTLQLRMVPIGETFARFRRVVRDTAADLGKEVALEIVGGETELDKSVVERIADPLMHLVRNALDHGLETPEQRGAQGKPAQGRLTLSACHESGSILIRIDDDGRGIDRDKVLQRAWDRGLVERDVVPPDADILKLIFEPGFSTAEKVTNLSGRGVGMDVVRRNIEALRGTVTVSSDRGQGSRIEIRMPLTLAIIDGFLVGVGQSKFIFPLDAVVEVIENRPTDTALDARGRGCVELRGQVLPVVSLRTLYAMDSPQPERSSVVVIRSGGARLGVLVDHLLGQHQTVIKPLGRLFASLRGMAGSSILGNGEVALIFDVNSLSELAAQQPHSIVKNARQAGDPGRLAHTSEGPAS